MFDSIDINKLIEEELGSQPTLVVSDNALYADTVSNIAERHW